MPFSLKQLARSIILLMGVASAQLIQAQAGTPVQLPVGLPDYSYASYEPVIERDPIDGYFYNQATTHNGRQVAQVLEPALSRLLESGELTSEEIKALEKLGNDLAQAPGGMGAALEQIAGSQKCQPRRRNPKHHATHQQPVALHSAHAGGR